MLRRIYNPIQDKDNGVLDGIVKFIFYGYLNTMDNITITTVVWMGHIIRMEDEGIPKKVLQGKLHNTRSVEKPRTRQEDVVQKDTSQTLGIRGWRCAKVKKNGGIF
jgi:hypothetical protein